MVKDLPPHAGEIGLTPGSGRSPGEGSGSPLQYSCLGNAMDRGAWRAMHFTGSQRVGRDRSTEYTCTRMIIMVIILVILIVYYCEACT